MNRASFAGRLGLLMLSAFVETLGNFLILALLPFYAERFGASPTVIGALIAAFAVAQTLTAPFWGRFSDRAGRRPVILLGLLLATVSYVVFAFSTTLSMLLLSRIAQGVAGGTVPVVFAYVSDTLEPQNRAEGLGWITSATSFAAMVGPAIGSLAAQYADEGPGLVVAAISALTFVLLWRFLKEPERSPEASEVVEPVEAPVNESPDSPLDDLKKVLTHPGQPVNALIWIYTTGMLAMTTLTAIVALYLARRFSVTEDNIWIFFAYLGGASIVMRLLVLGPSVRRFGELKLLRAGALLLALSMIALPFPRTLLLLSLAVLAVPVATAFLFPCTTALITRQVMAGEGVGRRLGVQQSFGGVSRIVAPLLAGWLFQHYGPSSPFWVVGAVLLVVALLSFRLEIVELPEAD